MQQKMHQSSRPSPTQAEAHTAPVCLLELETEQDTEQGINALLQQQKMDHRAPLKVRQP